MIHKLSYIISKKWIKQGIIPSRLGEVYAYGLEMIILSFVGIMNIFLIGLFTNTTLNACIFLVIFITIRKYSGGFHADSAFICNLLMILTYLLNVTISAIINYMELEIIIEYMLLASFVYYIIVTPVLPLGKILRHVDFYQNKIISIILFLVVYFLSSLFIEKINFIALTAKITLIEIVILLFAGKIKYRKQSGDMSR